MIDVTIDSERINYMRRIKIEVKKKRWCSEH